MYKKIKEIDQFYFILAGIFAVLAIIAILILRTIFSAFQTASSINEENLESKVPRIEKVKLEDTHKKLLQDKAPVLDL